jgi:sterol desaturase/sphingolipid hydroxylase (fatty acid hydroxylase superfamily)
VNGVVFPGKGAMQGITIKGMINSVTDSMLWMSRNPVNYWAEFALDIPLGAVLIFGGLRHRDTDSSIAFCPSRLACLFSAILNSVHRWLFHGSIPIFVEGHRAHHHIHHYHPETNFGVTSPLWDTILGTRFVLANHKKP